MFVLNKVEQRMFGLNRLGVWHGLRDSISDPSSDPMHLRHVPTDLEGIDIVQLYMYHKFPHFELQLHWSITPQGWKLCSLSQPNQAYNFLASLQVVDSPGVFGWTQGGGRHGLRAGGTPFLGL